MKSFRLFAFATILSFALLFALISQHGNVEASKKKRLIKNALMAALLLHGGKKILLPLPIPIPVPILKQTQPVYYEQPSYHPPPPPSYEPSYPSYPSYEPSYPSYSGSHY